MHNAMKLLFAMILFLARFMPIVAEGENEIHIQTAQDLCDLARNCALDTWSQGKVVMLDNDISLAGTDFTPIPIFNGIFDGGGHEIADLELLDDISPYGFILETGKDAEIRLLTVNGKIEPTYDSSKPSVARIGLDPLSGSMKAVVSSLPAVPLEQSLP